MGAVHIEVTACSGGLRALGSNSERFFVKSVEHTHRLPASPHTIDVAYRHKPSATHGTHVIRCNVTRLCEAGQHFPIWGDCHLHHRQVRPKCAYSPDSTLVKGPLRRFWSSHFVTVTTRILPVTDANKTSSVLLLVNCGSIMVIAVGF